MQRQTQDGRVRLGPRLASLVYVTIHANPLVQTVIGCAIEVHRALGPGLLESTYQRCLAHELTSKGIQFLEQAELPIIYKGARLDCGYRLDFLIEGELLVELKAVERVMPVHAAQVLTYLKLSGARQALLINFQVVRLVEGLKSFLRKEP